MSPSSAIHSTAPVADRSACASSRCRAETRTLGTATVMPRPIEAGVFGMARTRAARCDSACSRNASRCPAMIESTTVAAPTWGASPGMTSPAICGLTAMMIADASPMLPAGGLRRRPRLAKALNSRAGLGSRTAKFRASRPSASHPSSKAPPIFPAPTRRIVRDRWASVRALVVVIASFPLPSACPGEVVDAGFPTGTCSPASSLAGGLEHGGLERLARALAGPDHELKGREVPLAGIQRGPEQRFALPARGRHAPGQHQGMPVHDDPVLRPEVEMPDPHLLVDQRDQLLHGGVTALRHLELERASKMQRLDVVHPGERDLVVGPFPAHQDSDLVLAGTLEGPVVRRGHAFHDLQGINARWLAQIDKGHAVSTRSIRPRRCGAGFSGSMRTPPRLQPDKPHLTDTRHRCRIDRQSSESPSESNINARFQRPKRYRAGRRARIRGYPATFAGPVHRPLRRRSHRRHLSASVLEKHALAKARVDTGFR